MSLLPNTDYYARARYIGQNSGEGPWSNTVHFKTHEDFADDIFNMDNSLFIPPISTLGSFGSEINGTNIFGRASALSGDGQRLFITTSINNSNEDSIIHAFQKNANNTWTWVCGYKRTCGASVERLCTDHTGSFVYSGIPRVRFNTNTGVFSNLSRDPQYDLDDAGMIDVVMFNGSSMSSIGIISSHIKVAGACFGQFFNVAGGGVYLAALISSGVINGDTGIIDQHTLSVYKLITNGAGTKDISLISAIDLPALVTGPNFDTSTQLINLTSPSIDYSGSTIIVSHGWTQSDMNSDGVNEYIPRVHIFKNLTGPYELQQSIDMRGVYTKGPSAVTTAISDDGNFIVAQAFDNNYDLPDPIFFTPVLISQSGGTWRNYPVYHDIDYPLSKIGYRSFKIAISDNTNIIDNVSIAFCVGSKSIPNQNLNSSGSEVMLFDYRLVKFQDGTSKMMFGLKQSGVGFEYINGIDTYSSNDNIMLNSSDMSLMVLGNLYASAIRLNTLKQHYTPACPGRHCTYSLRTNSSFKYRILDKNIPNFQGSANSAWNDGFGRVMDVSDDGKFYATSIPQFVNNPADQYPSQGLVFLYGKFDKDVYKELARKEAFGISDIIPAGKRIVSFGNKLFVSNDGLEILVSGLYQDNLNPSISSVFICSLKMNTYTDNVLSYNGQIGLQISSMIPGNTISINPNFAATRDFNTIAVAYTDSQYNVDISQNVGNSCVDIFNRIGNVWIKNSTITISDPGTDPSLYTVFASKFTKNGTRLYLGLNMATTGGKAYAGVIQVYDLVNNVWTKGQTIACSSPVESDNFGYSFDVNENDTQLVACSNYASGLYIGSAYIFTKNAQGNWAETQIFPNSDTTGNTILGGGDIVVSNDGLDLYIGCPWLTLNYGQGNIYSTGSLYHLQYNTLSHIFTAIDVVDPFAFDAGSFSVSGFNYDFGSGVKLSKDKKVLLIGSPETTNGTSFNIGSICEFENIGNTVY